VASQGGPIADGRPVGSPQGVINPGGFVLDVFRIRSGLTAKRLAAFWKGSASPCRGGTLRDLRLYGSGD